MIQMLRSYNYLSQLISLLVIICYLKKKQLLTNDGSNLLLLNMSNV